MEYEAIRLATFIERPNRFIAICELEGERVTVHVKNTGRGKELFHPGVQVALNYQSKPTRKTAYDLVAIQKAGHWINIDSQAPNQIVKEAQANGTLVLPGIGQLPELRAEVVYHDSRLDFCGQTTQGETCWIEVKGVTLENEGIAAFPDAPTVRAVKHVNELIRAVKAGDQAVLLFVVQLDFVQTMTIYRERAPKLAAAIEDALAAGVQVVALDCEVTPATLKLRQPVMVDLTVPFHESAE